MAVKSRTIWMLSNGVTLSGRLRLHSPSRAVLHSIRSETLNKMKLIVLTAALMVSLNAGSEEPSCNAEDDKKISEYLDETVAIVKDVFVAQLSGDRQEECIIFAELLDHTIKFSVFYETLSQGCRRRYDVLELVSDNVRMKEEASSMVDECIEQGFLPERMNDE